MAGASRPWLLGVAVAALVVVVGTARPARADSDFFERPTPDVSIYDVYPWLDGAIIVGSNAVTIGLYGFGDGLITRRCPCDSSRVNSFDRPTIGNHSNTAYNIGTATVGVSLLAPVALDLLDLRRFWPVFEDVTIYVEALSLSGAFDTVAKFAAQRPFPRTYASDPTLVDKGSDYRSFYSGHTTLTFTALSVASMTVGRRYHHWVLPWVATVLVGSSVAAEMVLAGWHFPTDTIVGAVAGTAIGVTVPILHFSDLPVRPTLGVTPRGDGPALSFVGTWR
jgi:membrane-associated phospholipid phosphatase